MSAPRGYGPGPTINRIALKERRVEGEENMSNPFLKMALLWPVSLPLWVFDNLKTKSDLMVPVASGALAFGLYRYLAGSWRLPVNVEDFAKLYGVPAASVFVFDSYVVGRL